MQSVCGRLLRQSVRLHRQQTCSVGRSMIQRASQPPQASSRIQQQRRCLQCNASAEEAAAAEGDPTDAEVAEVAALPISQVDIRVGRVVEVEKHPDADSLYVEQVDVGEGEPRTIISGLVQFVPLDQMQERPVVVLANLKPRNMRGIKSHGMLLCASNAAHDQVEPLRPPADALPGERIFFGEGNSAQPDAESPNKVQKKKIWEELQPKLKTDDSKMANWDGNAMMTSAGPVTADNIAGGNIS